MQNEIFMDSPPPPYKRHADSIYLSDMDSNAWPSSYYGRTRRIDLAKFYHDILKASSNDNEDDVDQCNDSSSDEEGSQISQPGTTSTANNTIIITGTENQKKHVRFSTEPPMIYEYEAEFDEPVTTNNTLFDDGWPGRTKKAMNSTGFIDFKSKIEAKLGAINDPSLISELETDVQEPSLLYRGYYRDRKSPLVQKLNLRPIPNHQPSLIIESPSPSNSFTDSPLTPKDGSPLFNEPSVPNYPNTTTVLTPGGSKWLNRTLSRIRSNNPPRIK